MARARTTNQTVKVEGLREFRKAVKDLEGDFADQIKAGMKDIASYVAERAAYAFAAGPGVAPKVAPTVKAFAQATGATVKFGAARAPFALGAEFGGQRSKRTQQFQPWRGAGSGAGYFLYETLRRDNEEIGEMVGDLVDRIAAEAFPE